MVAAVTLTGVFLFVAVGPYSTLLADITPYRQRGQMGGLIAIAGVVGALIFTLLSIGLWDKARGWVFLITAVLVAASLVVVAFGVREPATQRSYKGEHTSARALVKALLAHKPLALISWLWRCTGLGRGLRHRSLRGWGKGTGGVGGNVVLAATGACDINADRRHCLGQTCRQGGTKARVAARTGVVCAGGTGGIAGTGHWAGDPGNSIDWAGERGAYRAKSLYAGRPGSEEAGRRIYGLREHGLVGSAACGGVRLGYPD